ncbi:hypothetical protein DMUE_4914 [Dictyocoela muelleri]|nr:hypothetical protein DMUE_4914 [Dictyocoela muelleri]
MENSTTQRVGIMLILQGYLYVIFFRYGNRVRWRCKNKICKGFLTIENDYLPVNKEVIHSCRSDEGKTNAILAKKKILERCRSTNEEFTSIFTAESSNLTTHDLTELTLFENLRDFRRRVRNERDKYLNIPQIDIPITLQSTLNGVKFLQHDSGVSSDNRYIIFFSDDFSDYIRELKIVILDGKFRSAPNQFYQLHTIYGYFYGKSIHLIFIVSKDKTEETYTQVFSFLKER